MNNNLKTQQPQNTRTTQDTCFIEQEEANYNKKFKYTTTNFTNILNNTSHSIYGMTLKDGLFVPANNVDSDSFLRYGIKGGILTNTNNKNEYGQLPFLTTPSKIQSAHGNIDTEDDPRLPSLTLNNRQTCNPHDSLFYNKSFYIFNDNLNIETPNPLKSVESKNFGPRGGLNSRFNP